MRARLRAFTMVAALAVIWIVFATLTDGTFFTPRNLALLARQTSVTAILGIGMVLVIVAGQIDLSVGALAGLMGAVSALAYVQHDLPLWAAFALALAAGTLLGGLQGTLVAYLGIPAFIVTLGGMLVFQGTLLGITGGVTTSPGRPYLFIGQTYVPGWMGWAMAGVVVVFCAARAVRSPETRWGSASGAVVAVVFAGVMNAYQGVPLPVLLVVVLAGLFAAAAQHTPFGRHLYAIGGNREAAFYSGVRIERHLIGVFALMGLLSAVAGVVLTARVGSATPDAGRTMELDAIAAAVIGGASLLGGRGTVWGALLGAMVMASLDNGMSLLNTESFWQAVIKGAILVAAVAADMAGQRGRG